MVRQAEGNRACLSMSPDSLHRLRSLIEVPFKHVDDAPVRLSHKLYRQRARTARKTLDRIETWQAECRVRAEAAGLPGAQAAEEKARLALLDHAEAMFAMEPATSRDWAFLAALVDQHWISEWTEQLVARIMKSAGIVHYWDADQTSAAEGHANVA